MSDIKIGRKRNSFVDISLSFEANPVTGDISVLRDNRAVNNSVKNIILTVLGEVPFNRELGSSVSSYLFDLVDDGTAGLLTLEIERAIRYNEPRARISSVVVEAQPDQHQFVATITYTIVGDEQEFVVSQILSPTR